MNKDAKQLVYSKPLFRGLSLRHRRRGFRKLAFVSRDVLNLSYLICLIDCLAFRDI